MGATRDLSCGTHVTFRTDWVLHVSGNFVKLDPVSNVVRVSVHEIRVTWARVSPLSLVSSLTTCDALPRGGVPPVLPLSPVSTDGIRSTRGRDPSTASRAGDGRGGVRDWRSATSSPVMSVCVAMLGDTGTGSEIVGIGGGVAETGMPLSLLTASRLLLSVVSDAADAADAAAAASAFSASSRS